jgi:hypothetical protein
VSKVALALYHVIRLNMIEFLRRLLSKLQKPSTKATAKLSHNHRVSPISVSYNEIGISLYHQGQLEQEVKWNDIDLIAIRIEDDFLPFPYWYVGNKDNLLRIPNDAVGSNELFFTGFNKHVMGYESDDTFKVIIEAATAMEGSFIVWRPKDAAVA